MSDSPAGAARADPPGTFAFQAWTGGLYSLYRLTLATFLLAHFLLVLPWAADVFGGAAPAAIPWFPNVISLWGTPVAATVVAAVGIVLCIPLALGWFDRVAAILLWYAWACLAWRNPLGSPVGFIGWLCLAHALTPAGPYGSWARRADADPGTAWTLPRALNAGAWTVLAATYAYAGWQKLQSPSWVDGQALRALLESPFGRQNFVTGALLALPPAFLRTATWTVMALELIAVPAILLRGVRPAMWALLLLFHLPAPLLLDWPDPAVGLVLIHLLAFDPAWLPAFKPGAREHLFYDGTCGLCSWAVRFLLSEDRGGAAFRLAPLDSETFRSLVPEHVRRVLPDSIVVRTAEGLLLTKSAAFLHVARRLGGPWRLLGAVVALLPRRFRDAIYDATARTRYRVFGRTTEACPLGPPHVRARFDL